MSTKKIVTELLTQAYVKSILPAVLSGFSGICCNIVTNEISSDIYTNKFIIFLILGCISVIFTVLLSIFYIKSNKTIRNSKLILEAFNSFADEFENSSNKLYTVIDNARTNNIIKLDAWNKSVEFDFICEKLYELICGLAQKGDNFSVSIIMKISDKIEEKTKYIMISRKAKNKDKPRIYKIPIVQSEAEKYYYGKLFKESNPEPSYLLTEEEIRDKFYFRENAEKNKYSQYIGIPICCKGNEVSSLIQIIGHEGSIISKNIEELKEIVNNAVFVYANFGLFCEKIEKGLLIKPTNKDQ